MDDPELLLSHRDFVHAVAGALVRDAATADDVAQETFVAAWRARGATIDSPRGFLATLATNFARQFRRGEQRRVSREQRAAIAERIPSVHDIAEREERRRAVVAAVLSLEVTYRDVVLLRYYEALPPRAIARQLGMPVETVRTRLKRGLERIRARLVAVERGDPRALLAWLLPLARVSTGSASRAKVGLLVGGALTLLLTGGVALEVVRRSAQGAAWRADPSIDQPVGDTSAHDEASQEIRVERVLAAAASIAPDPSLAPPLAVDGPQIAGSVVDARGAPIVGAEVFAWPDIVETPIELDDPAAPAARPRALSGAEGQFTLSLPAGAPDGFTLFARRDGFSAGVVRGIEPARDDVRLVLEDVEKLFGRVVDRRGDPIVGASVRALALHGGAKIQRRGRTDASGAFEIEAPLADRAAWQGDSESWRWWLEASAEGFAPRVIGNDRTLVADGALRVPIEIVLVAGARCSGRVVTAQGGGAVAGARVVAVAFEEFFCYARHAGGVLQSPYHSRILAETRSDASGAFEFDHLPARRGAVGSADESLPELMQLFVIASGFAIGFADLRAIDDGGDGEQTVELWRAATITGRVVDGDGAPIAGVRVAVLGERGLPSRATPPECVATDFASVVRTDAAGEYRFDGVSADATLPIEWSVTVDDLDWTDAMEGASVKVAVRAGETRRAPDLLAVHERAVAIEVVDSRGAPISAARVTLLPGGAESRFTDMEGRLAWSAPDAYEVDERGTARRVGESLRFLVARRGYASALTPAVTPDQAAPPRLRVELPDAHILEGVVLDPLLRPSPNASVRVLRHPPSSEDLEALRGGRVIDPTRTVSWVACDAAGHFRLDDLPAGSAILWVEPVPIATGTGRGRATLFLEVPLDGDPFTARLDDD